MIASVLFALTSAPQAPPTKVAYTFTAGELATYELKATIPVNDGKSKGELKGTMLMRTVSVAEDGTAEMSFLDQKVVVKAMGQTIELPQTAPLIVKVDRQGYLLAEPVGGSMTSLAVMMFGVPGEAMTVGNEVEWKPGGAFPAAPDQSPKAKLREVKGGRATVERSITTKEGQTIQIVSTHDLAAGRLIKGEITGKGQGGANVKLTLTLKGVEKKNER